MVGKAVRLLDCLVRSGQPLKIRGKDLFSNQVVLITASGLLDEQSLVLEQCRIREVG